MATIILIPCVFLRDLKVFTGQKRLLITVYSSFILNGGTFEVISSRQGSYLGSVTVLNGMFCCSIRCDGFDHILLFFENQVRFHISSFFTKIHFLNL